MCLGSGSLPDLSKALVAKRERAKTMQADINLRGAFAGFAKGSPKKEEEIKNIFPKAGDDRVKLTLAGGATLQLSIEAAIPAIEWLSKGDWK
jgi:hypothetical protein